MYAYLRRAGQSPEDAADLTQAFLFEVVLRRDLISRATQERGKFRSFLIAALRNFLIDEHRRKRRRGRTEAATFVPGDPETLRAAEPSEADDPTRAFNRQWASAVLDIALARLEQDCVRRDLGPHWAAFEARVLRPSLQGTEPLAPAAIAQQVGATDPEQVSSMIHTVKRRFRTVLRDVIAETVDEPEELEVELKDLRQFLSL